MIRITKPGDAIFFNVDLKQADEDQPLARYLDQLQEQGWQPPLASHVELSESLVRQARARRGSRKLRDEAVVYRLDVPAA
jgi:hypothetical protein